MLNEEVQTAVAGEPETTIETGVAKELAEPVAQEEVKPTLYKSFKSEEEWNDYNDKLRNRYQTQLLNELDVKSVAEIKSLKDDYGAKSKSILDLTSTIAELTANLEEVKTNEKIAKLNISDNHKEEFLTLVQAKTNADEDFNAVATKILANNPNWVVGSAKPNIGTAKSESKNVVASTSKVRTGLEVF